MAPNDPSRIHQAFADAVNTRSLDQLVDLFDAEAVVVERDGTVTVGAERIREHLAHLLALEPTMRIDASRAFVNGELALLCSSWSADATAPDGTPVRQSFRGCEVARRQPDGTWRLVLDNPWGIDAADSA